MTFAKKLTQLREKKGLSQTGLAKASGLTIKAINTYENGLRSPSAEALFSLAKALGVSCAAFEGCRFTRARQPKKK